MNHNPPKWSALSVKDPQCKWTSCSFSVGHILLKNCFVKDVFFPKFCTKKKKKKKKKWPPFWNGKIFCWFMIALGVPLYVGWCYTYPMTFSAIILHNNQVWDGFDENNLHFADARCKQASFCRCRCYSQVFGHINACVCRCVFFSDTIYSLSSELHDISTSYPPV